MKLFLFQLLLILTVAKGSLAAPIHIVAYGDSGVYGKGVARNETYPAQLEGMLRQKGYGVTVINAGVNGRTSSDAVAGVDALGGADVVIVQFGVNDAKHGVSLATIRKNIETVVSKLKQRGTAVLVVSYPSADSCGVASSEGVPCVRWGGLPAAQFHVPGDPQNHFNAAGLQVMASRMLPPLEKLIGPRP
jgi:acyl-CoA thioesterase-1